MPLHHYRLAMNLLYAHSCAASVYRTAHAGVATRPLDLRFAM